MADVSRSPPISRGRGLARRFRPKFGFPVVSPFRLRVSHYLDHATSPAPSTSHATCGFPALRAPFASRQSLWDLSCWGSTCPSRASGWSSLTTPWGFPCCVRFPCVHAAANTPVQQRGVLLRSFTPAVSAFPERVVGSACASSFSRCYGAGVGEDIASVDVDVNRWRATHAEVERPE